MGKPAAKPSNKPTSGDDVLSGSGGPDIIHGLAGNDQISGGGGQDRLYGDEGNDILNGDDGNDFLFGGSGADTLNGGTGNDDLRGEDGNDILNGGIGDDSVNGGAGADVLTGGSGADHFDFMAFSDSAGSTVDRITDYSLAAGDDLVFASIDSSGQVIGLDANAAVAGLQKWDYVSQLGSFSGENGQATLIYDAATNQTTLSLYNKDGDTTADFSVIFDGLYGVGDIAIHVLDHGQTYDGIVWPGP